jgi:CDP-diacylglycerol--glycerol-3-phosphate 3-phosphatidyltransferase
VRADDATFLAGWSRIHDGIEVQPSSLVGHWLRLMARLAAPLVRRRVSPSTLTAVAVAFAAATVMLVTDRWLLLAAAATVALSGVFDGLDGAVALLSGLDSRWGYLVDSVADRVADALLLLAMWRAGGDAAAALSAAAALALLEYSRARASAAGLRVTVVTVGERPTRLAVTAMTFVSATVFGHVGVAVTTGAAAVAAVSAAGWLHLMVVARRALRPSGAPDHLGDDRRRQGHERDAAAGVRGPTDEEQPADR